MDRLLHHQAYVLDSYLSLFSITASLTHSLVRCHHLYSYCCSVGCLLLVYAKEVRLVSSSYPYLFVYWTSFLPVGPLADIQNPPRQAHDPNYNRYLQTPHLRLHCRNNRSLSPNSLVSILRNHSSRNLRYLDPRLGSMFINSLFRIMFIRKSRRTYILRYIRLLLGITSYRQCRLDYAQWWSIWWMVLLWPKESSWWCTQGSYF